MVEPIGTALVPVSEFGPFHALVYRAHQLYMDGFSEHAVRACREWVLVTTGAGDIPTTRYLRYIEGITLQELGRHHEAVTVALDLLSDVDDDPDPMWRAKALALLAESSTQVGEVSRAMDALAEGTWLVANTRPGHYNHLSASMAVALALRAVYLFEQADELLAGIRISGDLYIDLQVVQERALLSAFWGTTLLLVGHVEAAAPHLITSAERALRMGRIAALAGNPEMAARAEVIEAYALSRLGYADLAAARVNAATQRFRLRDELVETHLARLVFETAARTSHALLSSSRSPTLAASSSPTLTPVASSTSNPSAYAVGNFKATASTCSALSGSGSSGSSRGKRTWTRSRAGFGAMPPKSNTIASAVTLLRIVSRALPSSTSFPTSPATSAGLISSTGRSPRTGMTRASATRCCMSVLSRTSTRDALHLSATSARRGAALGSVSADKSGTRIAANSPSIHGNGGGPLASSETTRRSATCSHGRQACTSRGTSVRYA